MLGCGTHPEEGSDVGAIGLALQVVPGVTLNSVSYSITGPGGFTRAGSLDTSQAATVSGVIGGLPAGASLTISLTSTSNGGGTTCAGAAAFTVTAHATTAVTVHMLCHEAPKTGSILVEGTINVCPNIDAATASPSEAVVGASIALMGAAHDTDGAPAALSYSWTTSAGTLSGATTRNPTLTCTDPGTATLTLTVSDGDAAPGCADTQTIDVTCTKGTATLALFGDWPYGNIINGEAAFIAQVNADPDVELALHIGDIHSGSQPCGDAYNQQIFGFFQTFADPLVYTPGDNEWTDCQKVKELSSGAPLDELRKLRALFFPNPGKTLGGVQKTVLTQANAFDPAHPEDAAYVENVMWQRANVLFVTLNFPGSDDDHLPWAAPFSNPAAQADEIAKRDAANGRWIAKAFAAATSAGNAGILIGTQADMWDPAQFAPGGDGLDGYDAFVQQLASLAIAFGKPVLLVNGDSHLFESDQPLADPASATGVIHHVGFPVSNLTRITVDGSTNFHDWVKLVVDSTTPAVFTWTRVNTP